MKRLTFLTIFLVLACSHASFADTMLNTKSYYPVPYGSYEKLHLNPQPLNMNECSTDAHVGRMVYDSGNDMLVVCKDTGSSKDWVEFGGLWNHVFDGANSRHNVFLTSNNIWTDDTANEEEIRLGIGTTEPRENLQIVGQKINDATAFFVNEEMDGAIITAGIAGVQLIGKNDTVGATHIVLTGVDPVAPNESLHWSLNHYGPDLNNNFSISHHPPTSIPAKVNFYPTPGTGTEDFHDYLTITTDGIVGIGTSDPFGTWTPKGRLHLDDGSSSNPIDWGSTTEFGFSGTAFLNGEDVDLALVGQDGDNAGTDVFINAALKFVEVKELDGDPDDLEFENLWAVARSATGANPSNALGDGGKLHFIYNNNGTQDWKNFNAPATTNVMTLQKDHKIGVGTSNPAYQFHVKDTASGPVLAIEGENPDIMFRDWDDWEPARNIRGHRIEADNDKLHFRYYGSSAGEQNVIGMTLDNDKFGIGTTSPNAALHIATTDSSQIDLASAAPAFELRDNTAGAYDYRISANGNKLQINADNPADADPGDFDTPVLTIDNTGRVGIGDITTPAAQLHIGNDGSILLEDTSHEIQFEDDNNIDFRIECCSVGATSARGKIMFQADTDADDDYSDETAILWVQHDAGGNIDNFRVAINHHVPTEMLDVAGNVLATGTIDSSDMRYKEDIKTINNAFDKIIQLSTVNYQWIDPVKPQDMQIGLLAQDVEKVFPEVVHTNAQGVKAVDYEKLISALIEAIKELREEKDAEIKALKKRMDDLSGKLK